MDEKQTKEIYRQRIAEQINKVPIRVQHGSIQVTREWMKRRDAVAKLIKKPGATLSQLMAALQSIE